MKKSKSLIKKTSLIIIIFFLLLGCSTNKYQKNYDLGIKYLEEGDYENAIISLNAAIEIEPKEEAYLALAKIYDNSKEYDKISDVFSRRYADCGTIPFEERDAYYDFNEMTSDEQTIVNTICNAVINNNIDLLYDLLNTQLLSFEDERYTMWNGYKVKLLFIPYKPNNGYDDYISNNALLGRIWIVLRPEKGIGYLCNATSSYTSDDNSERIFGNTLIMCPCIDWQWNGDYTETFIDNESRLGTNGHIEKSIYNSTTTGKIVNNLREGDFITKYNNVYDWIDSDIEDEEYTVAATYKNGMPANLDIVVLTGVDKSSYNVELDDFYYDLYW